MRILNGTIRFLGADAGVALRGADRSLLRELTITRFPAPVELIPGAGIVLSNSNHNRLARSSVDGGGPAVLLTASDNNEISRSSMHGEICAFCQTGNGLEFVAGSDENTVVDSSVTGAADGTHVFDSDGNRIARSDLGGYSGAVLLNNARGTVISRNTMGSGFGPAVGMLSSDDNLIRGNQSASPIEIDGARNRIEGNEIPIGSSNFTVAIGIAGDANLVRNNHVGAVFGDGIAVVSEARQTLVEGNVATESFDDGIDVQAPGTLIRHNTANDNGDLGIEAVPGVIDGGNNRASGNGNPLQCLNVVCR